MTLHWWMHWFWITSCSVVAALLLSAVAVEASPVSSNPLETDSNNEHNLEEQHIAKSLDLTQHEASAPPEEVISDPDILLPNSSDETSESDEFLEPLALPVQTPQRSLNDDDDDDDHKKIKNFNETSPKTVENSSISPVYVETKDKNIISTPVFNISHAIEKKSDDLDVSSEPEHIPKLVSREIRNSSNISNIADVASSHIITVQHFNITESSSKETKPLQSGVRTSKSIGIPAPPAVSIHQSTAPTQSPEYKLNVSSNYTEKEGHSNKENGKKVETAHEDSKEPATGLINSDHAPNGSSILNSSHSKVAVDNLEVEAHPADVTHSSEPQLNNAENRQATSQSLPADHNRTNFSNRTNSSSVSSKDQENRTVKGVIPLLTTVHVVNVTENYSLIAHEIASSTLEKTIGTTAMPSSVHNEDIGTDETVNLISEIPTSVPISNGRIAASATANEHHASGLDAASITGIALGIVVFSSLTGAISFVLYRRRYLNKPQTLNDKCSNPDSSGYIDDSTLRENSEEMYSLDNDSFLNSLEAMTIQNYWTDNVKHTKL